MSMSCCPECRNKQKQLQILKADLDFQIKRMHQDVAQEKVMLQLNFQKQQKKNIEKYHKEKQQRQEQNKQWIAKYDNMVASYQFKNAQSKQKYQMQVSHLKQTLLKEYEVCQLQKQEKFRKEFVNMTTHYNEEIKSLKEKQNLELISQKSKYETIINVLTNSHLQKVNQLTYDYESRIKKLRKEIDQVIKEKQNFKKQTHQKQTSLYHQIYQRKQEINNLKYQMDKLNARIKNYQEEIRCKNVQISMLKEKNQQILDNIKKEHITEKFTIIQDFKRQIEELLLKKLEDCQHFEQNVKQIQVKRQKQIKIYQNYMQEVNQLVQERPSRNQDVEQITILKDLLNKKQKQFQKVAEQAKSYRLQLDYKEETFNRIFRNSTNPLHIQKICKKREVKLPRGSAIGRQNIKYNSITMQGINTPGSDFKREKSIQLKSNKMF